MWEGDGLLVMFSGRTGSCGGAVTQQGINRQVNIKPNQGGGSEQVGCSVGVDMLWTLTGVSRVSLAVRAWNEAGFDGPTFHTAWGGCVRGTVDMGTGQEGSVCTHREMILYVGFTLGEAGLGEPVLAAHGQYICIQVKLLLFWESNFRIGKPPHIKVK